MIRAAPLIRATKLAGRTRRRAGAGLWLAVLALVVQLTAPFGAALAMAARAGDLADPPICAAHQDNGNSPDRRHADDEACPLCQICCATPQLLVSDAAPPVPTPRASPLFVTFAHHPGLPRGPPADPPNARAPPLS